MRPVSDEFLRTLRGSHTMVARARVCTTFQTGVTPTGTIIPIFGGDVQMDATADVRSTLDLTTDGTGMWPTRADSLLAPYGNEVFVERGIRFGNGTTEWVSLGYFRIYRPGQQRVPDGPIRLDGRDRMSGIVDARLTSPVQIPATTTFGGATSQLVTEVYPSATIEWDDTAVRDTQIGRATIAEEDRYAYLKELWDSVGKVGHWDHRGILVIATPPDPSDPVFDVNHGAGGVLVDMSRELSRESVYNGVVASGEAADTTEPPRALAVDDNPDSPTYWHGRFGKVPRFFFSPFITNPGQAFSAAAGILARSLGLPYNVDFTAVPNPALTPYDPVRVSYSDRHAREVHVLEQLTVPLVADGALTAGTREQSTILIGVG